MLLFGPNASRHRTWFLVVLVGTLAATIWYIVESLGRSTLPGGSSLPGFTFGVLGGLIILFEMLLWPRKKLRIGRFGPIKFGSVKAWMRAHIWLGLFCVPLAILHTGFRLGGTVPTLLMILFTLVIVSGVWGLYLQHIIPRKMFDEVPGETIVAQIPEMMRQHAFDAQDLIDQVAPLPRDVPEAELAPEGYNQRTVTLESIDVIGRVQGKVLVSFSTQAGGEGGESLRRFFEEHVAAYLVQGEKSGSPLSSQMQANRLFADLEKLVPPTMQPLVDALRGKCDLRRQLDRQVRMHMWLHNWLCVHLPLSVALTILLGVHIWSAIYYW